MDREPDYREFGDSELIDKFSRVDRRFAGTRYGRLKEILAERGYCVRAPDGGPGSVVPTPEKMQALIGSSQPIECRVAFSQSAGPFSWLEPAPNDFHLASPGTLEADGLYVRLRGRRSELPLSEGWFGRTVELQWSGIVNVESEGEWIRFAYRLADSSLREVIIRLQDPAMAGRLVAVLPGERTTEFNPQLREYLDFERKLVAQSPAALVTVGLIVTNAVVFLAMVVASSDWFRPSLAVSIAWGSDFAPYTTAGDWWRLITAVFVHFSIVHLTFNLWAIASFGPLAERLFGRVNYLIIYLCTGMTSNLVSITWRPDINSAGASGAVFGLLGAMLSAQLVENSVPPWRILRPLRTAVLAFTGFGLIAGFLLPGVDNAAHLGGLCAGLLLGWCAARPLTGDRSYGLSDLRRTVTLMLLFAMMSAAGLWAANGASVRLVGEGLYWHTLHTIMEGEKATDHRFNVALQRAKVDGRGVPALIAELKDDVVPFWQGASVKASAIRLEPGSSHQPAVQRLQIASARRREAFQLLLDGIRENDGNKIGEAERKLENVKSSPPVRIPARTGQ